MSNIGGEPAAKPARVVPLRCRLGGWTWLYLMLTVGSSISAILEPGAAPWQRVLTAAFVPVAVWGVLLRQERPLVLPAVAIAMAATCTDAVLLAAMFSLALRRRDRVTVLMASVAIAVVVVVLRLDLFPLTMGADLTFEGQLVPAVLEPPLLVVADIAILVGLPMLLGAFLGQRRALVASLEERASRAEEERELRAAQAVADERQRLAGEMHDVVGHKLALISMQAGALEINPAAAADVVEEQATAVRISAREAQAELRALLDVVHRPVNGDGAPLAPQPGLKQVPTLVAGARAAGARVRLVTDVDGEPAPGLGRAAHRVVREGLTNALGHAPGNPVDVSVAGDGHGGLVVEVANPLPAAAPQGQTGGRPGTGLASLAERVRVLGGRFDAGPAAGRWVLRVVLPAPDDPAGRSSAAEGVVGP